MVGPPSPLLVGVASLAVRFSDTVLVGHRAKEPRQRMTYDPTHVGVAGVSFSMRTG